MSEFDQKAQEWDDNKMHHDRTLAIAKHLQDMVTLRPGMKAMEFGAGTGLLSFHLKDLFSEITLVDNSPEMLKMAEKKMVTDDRLKFRTLNLNLETEEFTGDPFDIIYNQMVLHHIGNVSAIIRKFHKLLTPGGILVIADLYSEDGSFHDGATNVHRGFDPEDLAKILLKEGFSEMKIEPGFVIRKALPGGEIIEYPLFLLTAHR